MDFEQQILKFERMEQESEAEQHEQFSSSEDDQEPFNKFKIQSLEEVTERSEESDLTMLSYNSGDLDNVLDISHEQDTILRVKVMDEIEHVQKELLNKLFGDCENPPVPFVYDFEDFSRCKLNIELKKLISSLDVTLPIVQTS